MCIRDSTLFDWSLEQLVANGWHFSELTYDLHESNLADDYKIMTTYEQKWTSQGLPIMLVAAR
jgi:tRNA (guanine-N7-)-methyltransferase